MEQVEQYLKTMAFKKRVVGGIDEENALLHIKKICDLYQEKLQEKYIEEQEFGKVQSDLKETQKELEQQKAAYVALQAKMADAELEIHKWKEKIAESSSQETEKVKQEYELKYKELTDAVNAIQSVKKEAAVQAQIEAAQEAARLRSEIMTQIEDERLGAEETLRQLRSEIDLLQRRKKEIQKAIRMESGQWLSSLGKTIEELQGMKIQISREIQETEEEIHFPTVVRDGCHAG